MVDKEDSASLPPADVQRPDDEAWCRCGHEWTDHQVPRAGSNFSTWCNICGTDCAGVQRPTPPLTEEELAEMEQFRGVCGYLPDYWKGGPRTTDRLFATIHAKDADLRASRERIKELEAKLAWVDERIDSGEL